MTRNKSELNLLSDHPDQVLFVSAFLAGLVLIAALKTIFAGVGAFLALLSAVAIIFIYPLVAFRFKGVRLSDDRIGDNCYYLGFLFTLISLSLALYSFTSGAPDPRSLVADFGIALGSTITGIFVRIVIQQMRVESEQIGEEVKRGLTELAVETSAELQNVIAEVSSLSESFKDTLKTSADEVATVAKKATKALERLIESLESQVAFSSSRFIDISTQMDTSVAGLAGAFEDARANISRTQVPVPSDLFSGVSQQVSSTSREIANLNSALVELVLKVQSARENWVDRVRNEKLELPSSVFTGFDSIVNELVASVRSLNAEISNLQSARHQNDLDLSQKLVSVPNESIQELSSSIKSGVIELEKLFSSISAINRSIRTPAQNSNVAPEKRTIFSKLFRRK